MTPSTLIFAIRAVNVPAGLQHKSRKLEIEELPDFLQVEGKTPGQLYLINMGNATPSADASGYPWLKVAADGMPDGLYVKHNGVWYPAELHGCQAPHINFPMIQTGQFTVAATATAKDHEKIVTFTTEYASAPKVFLTLTANSVDDNSMVDEYIIEPSTTGFSLNNLHFDGASNLTFDWLAIGIRNPAA
jgi:hypothetical protein